MRGDCGSWVVDALTGDVYGQIVAGDHLQHLAFIIPAYKIWEDIQNCFGTLPLLPAEEHNALLDYRSTITSYLSSRDSSLFSNHSMSTIYPTMSTQPVSSISPLHQQVAQGHSQFNPTGDTSGQKDPGGMRPRVTATLWDGCICFHVDAKKICVSRRDGKSTSPGTLSDEPIN